jgi:hypothetical protein
MHVPHATNVYGKFKNLNLNIFLQKRLFQIKTALTFAYGHEKNRIIYQKLYTQNFTSDFNGHRPFAQFLASQNSKGKYESRKILDFLKMGNKIFFKGFFHFFCCFFYFFSYFEVFY